MYFSTFFLAIIKATTTYNWLNVVPFVLTARYFDGQVRFYRFLGLLDTKSAKKLRKKSKNPFFRQFPWLDMAILRPKPVPIGQKWHSLCLQGGILIGKYVFTGCWVHRTKKMEKK